MFDEKDQIVALLSINQTHGWWIGEDDSLITQGHPNLIDLGVYQVTRKILKKREMSNRGG